MSLSVPHQKLLLRQTASDLESMRCLPVHDGIEFPIAARALLYSLPGNQACVDCGAPHPTWASVSFGTLLCLQCSGKHRSLGVATSFVRSVDMDAWSHKQVLSMLEGGNAQWQQFLERHHLTRHGKRYHTKAAKFYRTHLAQHAQQVADAGTYQGREVARQRHCPQQQQQQQEQQSPSSEQVADNGRMQQSCLSSPSQAQHHHHHHGQPQQQRIAVVQ